MTDAEFAELLKDVKNELCITWDDDKTEARLSNIIRAGMAYLDDKRGAAADYSAAGFPRTLLFEYVRYARDYALDVFENNYRHLILAMTNERRTDDAEEDAETT